MITGIFVLLGALAQWHAEYRRHRTTSRRTASSVNRGVDAGPEGVTAQSEAPLPRVRRHPAFEGSKYSRARLGDRIWPVGAESAI